jgi:CopG family nickel-responsive transcriptional regulator
MDHHNCLEVTIVKGNAFAVQELAEKMIALRGVKSGNLTMSSTGDDLH